jgi:lipopolysaccharide/colanic/teichoic acid biosynthesis glycosyltransferase
MVSIANLSPMAYLPFEAERGYLLLFPWILQWRNRHLWIRLSKWSRTTLILEDRKQALMSCLQFSNVRVVRIDTRLPEVDLVLWANACAATQKQLFLQIPPAVCMPHQRQMFWWMFKRLCDWIAALGLLILLGPLMLMIMALMWVWMPGPFFFKQWRVGQRGRLFEIVKFRTMIPNADQLHHQVMGQQQGLHKRKDDPRITPLGRWLRKFSLDELPQLWNVLKGDMSLVGPRPWALYDAVRLPPEGYSRLNALPGITGPWQVQGRSSVLDLGAVTRLDLNYLHHWSILKDLTILVLTVPKVLSGIAAH